MAVRSVWGVCGGAEIRFERNAAGQWETTVPAQADNTYVVELWAEDDAGNVGYYATVLFTFDPVSLRYSFRMLDTETKCKLNEMEAQFGWNELETSYTLEKLCLEGGADFELELLPLE